jgi:hypothetical protein
VVVTECVRAPAKSHHFSLESWDTSKGKSYQYNPSVAKNMR